MCTVFTLDTFFAYAKWSDEVMSFEIYDLRVTVVEVKGQPVCTCGMRAGDYFELIESSKLHLPEGGHFCIYALSAVLPLLPAKQRQLDADDWLEQDSLVACPDPEEGIIMKIERIKQRSFNTEELT